MADDWDPFADPSLEAEREATPAPSVRAVDTAADARLLEQFTSGQLDTLVEEYRQAMRAMPNGPALWRPGGEPRPSGAPVPFGPEYVPVSGEGGDARAKLVLYGDSITHASPVCLSAPFCAAVAQRNAEALVVENAGWGGMMALMMSAPSDFQTSFGPLPLPAADQLDCRYACILVGTNDAMSMCAPEAWTSMFKTVKNMEKAPDGGPPRLPEDWATACCPSAELFERNLRSFAEELVVRSGATVAIATPPALGEDLSESLPDRRMRRSPFAAVGELAAAVRRVAKALDCDVLPLFECMTHRLKAAASSGHTPIPWTHSNFGRLMMDVLQHPETRKIPLEDLGAEGARPALCYDLVHFNETGGAIYAALVQAWLDSRADA